MNKWRDVLLSEIATYTTGKLNSNAEVVNGTYPFFTCSPTTLRIDNYAFDTEALILAGNNANGVFSLKYYNGRFNAYQRTYIISIKDLQLTDYKFLFYALKTQLSNLEVISHGTATKYLTLPILNQIPILLLPLPEQRVIASVLSSLDDKVDLLHRQNKTLEAMAETFFRQWFVPARAGEPHAGGEEVQEDWEEGKLGEIIGISSGKGLKKKEYVENGSYPVLGANGEIGRTDKCLFDEKLIFTGRVGTLGKIFISTGKVWLSDNTLIIKPKEDYFYFIYFLLKNVKLEEYNVGSTQPLIRQSDIKEIEIFLPKKEQLYNFEAKADLFFKKMQNNQLQIRILEQLRDALLPNLMSGEVRMKV